MSNSELIKDILERGVVNIIPSGEALKRELESRRLNVYLGIDPTAVRIHLGHAVLLRKLAQLGQLGHSVTFLIGDFTALIGDTSDKDSERPRLTGLQIKENFATYKQQAEKFIDFAKVKLVHNSDWLKRLTFEDIVKLSQHFSAGDFVGRELIKKRLASGQNVGLHELLYPLMQGYDSYYLDTDLQLGGTDQTFNMAAGRTLQKDLRNKESFVLAGEFLPGTDGRKMSKTWGNAIWLDDSAAEIYGKVMSLADGLIVTYFTLATNLPLTEIDGLKADLEFNRATPLAAKKRLAFQIVSELHGPSEAQMAENEFEQIFQKRELPTNIATAKISGKAKLINLLVSSGLTPSASEAKRLILQGAVRLAGEKIADVNFILGSQNKGAVIKVGKRKFVRLA